jgi:ribonuclease BN (tRNA processing enzyme)
VALDLTVLGCTGSHAGPTGGPCSGYLVRTDATAIWVDCGNGTFGPLQRHVAPADLTAVVITHAHPDHCVDLYGLHVVLRHELGRTGLPVLAADGVEERMRPLAGRWGDAFAWRTVGDGDTARVGDLDLRFSRTDHPVPTCAVEAVADGRRLVYTADTGPGWGPGAFGPAADLVLSEATYLHAEGPVPIHLSAREAGEGARAASASRLVLTHLGTAVDRAAAAAEAAEAFGAPVTVAAPGLTLAV